MNEFLIGIQGDSIVSLKPIPQRLSKDRALELASWLVALADNACGGVGGNFDVKMKQRLEGN